MRPKEYAYRSKKRGPTTPSFELTTLLFRKIYEQFAKNIEILGYNQRSQVMIPSCVREFLFKMEERKIRNFKNIKQEDIKEHYEYLNQRPNFVQKKSGLSSIMINHHMYSIRLFFTYLEEINQIKENPISALSFPSPEAKQREILSPDEIKELYEVTETFRDKAILNIFYGCGLRREEGVRLNIRDIHFRNNLLYVREGKGCKRRVVPMANKISNELKHYYIHERNLYVKKKTKDNQEAFLLDNVGNRMSGNSCNNRFKKLIQSTGNIETITKEPSLHNLRHSIATHLLENGLSIEKVRDFLGHSDLKSTEIYTKVNKKLIKSI